jgi:membrane associated rhomboid family serine protease
MAFLQPDKSRQPILHVPTVVVLLIGTLVAAHVARTLVSPEQSMDWIGHYAFIPARYGTASLFQSGTAGVFGLVVPFFSYIALHNDYTHLAINCLWLLAFGPIVARRFGAPLFLLFFAICGLAGAAAHLSFNWGSPEPVIGASAAISGLMAAGIRLLPTQSPAWASPGAPAQAPMLPLWSRQIILFTLVWAAVNLAAGLTGLGMGEAGQIAWQAHMGGFIAGLALSGPFDRLRPQPVGEQL